MYVYLNTHCSLVTLFSAATTIRGVWLDQFSRRSSSSHSTNHCLSVQAYGHFPLSANFVEWQDSLCVMSISNSCPMSTSRNHIHRVTGYRPTCQTCLVDSLFSITSGCLMCSNSSHTHVRISRVSAYTAVRQAAGQTTPAFSNVDKSRTLFSLQMLISAERASL